MAYRNPLAWDRNLRPGLFTSDPNAKLPEAEKYSDSEPTQLDIELRLQKDYAEIDRMNEELDAMYTMSMLPPINSIVIPYSGCHRMG